MVYINRSRDNRQQEPVFELPPSLLRNHLSWYYLFVPRKRKSWHDVYTERSNLSSLGAGDFLEANVGWSRLAVVTVVVEMASALRNECARRGRGPWK